MYALLRSVMVMEIHIFIVEHSFYKLYNLFQASVHELYGMVCTLKAIEQEKVMLRDLALSMCFLFVSLPVYYFTR